MLAIGALTAAPDRLSAEQTLVGNQPSSNVQSAGERLVLYGSAGCGHLDNHQAKTPNQLKTINWLVINLPQMSNLLETKILVFSFFSWWTTIKLVDKLPIS